MRTLACLAGFVVFGLILFFVFGDAFVDEHWFDRLGGWAWLLAVGLLIADIVIPIPTTLIITAMGQQYGPLLGGLIGTLGTFSAGVVAYGFTRMLGERFARWLLRDELENAHVFFETKGAFAVACSRWLPLLPEAISCLAGLARMPLRRYCVALLSGAAPMAFAYAGLASISDDKMLPLIVSVVLPVPIWWIAGRMLRAQTRS